MSLYPPPSSQRAARPRLHPRSSPLGRTARRRARNRWLVHLLALLVLLALAVPGHARLLSQEAEPGSAAASDGAEAGESAPALGLPLGGLWPQRVAPTLLPTPLPTPEPTPAPSLPAWVQNQHVTTLWAAPEPGSASVREVPQGRRLRTLGPATGERLLVEDPGDGGARLPARGWVDASAAGPAGPPEVEWQLALQPDAPGAPRWQGQAWPQGISAEFAVVLDGTSGQVLYGKDAHGRVAPASLTKIATAIVALERGQLSDLVQVSVDSSAMPGSTVMGLSPGERLSLRALLYGLMLPSGNDAALAIAQHIGGSEARFVDLMNELVARLELKDTHFINPHGLDAQGHFSSPYDMAMLARHGMRDLTFATLAGARSFEGEGYHLTNLNRLLWSYEGADGVKPGYTEAAGRALVGSATRDGHRVFVALMQSPDLWGDVVGLLNYAFRSFRWD
ncbi:MAG: D-alanyl-D-alanine carboxypeptidase [Chloroflexi bacterium]|nr:D-alanyl-D-alanine carboxypeptidase [Chloroflexota bacterium]